MSLEAFEAYSRGMLNLRMASRDAVDRAIGLFERALEISPGYVEAMIALGSALDLKGAFLAMPDLLQRSLELLQQAVALKPDSAEAHIRLGETLADLGQIDEGIAEMHEGLRLAPDNAEAHANLARNYWMGKGDAELAITHFRRALALNPDAGYTHLQLALLHALRGELDEAEREARAAVVLQEQAMSGTQGLLLVGARSRLGYVFYRRGQYDEAIREYRRELEFVSMSDHALRERTTIEICQKLAAAYQRKGDRGERADLLRPGGARLRPAAGRGRRRSVHALLHGGAARDARRRRDDAPASREAARRDGRAHALAPAARPGLRPGQGAGGRTRSASGSEGFEGLKPRVPRCLGA